MNSSYLQLNIIFTSFPFFSSQFPGTIKVLNHYFFIFPLLFCNNPQLWSAADFAFSGDGYCRPPIIPVDRHP